VLAGGGAGSPTGMVGSGSFGSVGFMVR
jgi:hypothetical protein